MPNSPNKPKSNAPRVQDAGWIFGRLVAHGAAHYKWDPDASMSYYVRLDTLETEQGARQRREQADQAARPMDGRDQRPAPSVHDGGTREIWGADLARAIRESRSGVEVGKIVGAKIVSREPLLSDHFPTAPKRGATGYWNKWEVETVQFIAQRNRFARAVNENYRNARQDGVVGREALALYLIHEGARRLAAERYPNADDRKTFVDRVKSFFDVSPEREAVIARAVARVNALKAAKQSDPTQQRAAEARDRERPAEPLTRE
jgi:hypothetical protein